MLFLTLFLLLIAAIFAVLGYINNSAKYVAISAIAIIAVLVVQASGTIR